MNTKNMSGSLRGLAGLLALGIASVAQAYESYEDFYGDGDIVYLEAYEVTAEPDYDWVIEYDTCWDTLLDDNFWDGLDSDVWGDYIATLDDAVDWARVDCLGTKHKALLAQGAYTGQQTIGNDNRVTDPQALQALGINPAQLSDSNGFQAVIYQNAITGGLTVSFAGTNGASVSDWATNAGQSFGLETGQYNMAMQLATAITANPGTQVEFVGHSLGGGLASAASVVTGRAGTTFNAAGLHSDTALSYNGATLANANNLIDAFYVGGEILSSAQDSSPLPNAAGERHRLTPAAGLEWYETLEKHAIQSAINSLPC